MAIVGDERQLVADDPLTDGADPDRALRFGRFARGRRVDHPAQLMPHLYEVLARR